jgi:hypothetical protein
MRDGSSGVPEEHDTFPSYTGEGGEAGHRLQPVVMGRDTTGCAGIAERGEALRRAPAPDLDVCSGA